MLHDFFKRNTMRPVYTSTVVVDHVGESQIGEIWAIDLSPYDGVTPAAYVVGEGWADWIALDALQPVNGTALMTVGAVKSAVA